MPMNIEIPLLISVGLIAGTLGSLLGIGGGLIVVPSLVLLFGIDIKVAVATSLIAVITSSNSAGSVYVGNGTANMRLGMFLEIATTLGAITGGILAIKVSSSAVSALFSVLTLISAILIIKPQKFHEISNSSSFEGHLPGSIISYIAGIFSGMLGVGGGFLKVPAMTHFMKVPIKTAVATSNFMIGVTAVTSLFVYLTNGFVVPQLAAPVVIGATIGSLLGTQVAKKIPVTLLKKIFAVLLILVSLQMLLKALGVHYA